MDVERTAWQPVLVGGLADRAHASTLEIAEALLVPSFDRPADPSLAGGDAGIALFHAYLARSVPPAVHEVQSRGRLERAVATLAGMRTGPGFFAGFSGIAWTVEHLLPSVIEAHADDLNESIDEALEAGLGETARSTARWENPELISGLAGFGIYALERLPRPGARRIVESIVARLAAVSERTPEGLTWWTAPEQLPDFARELTPAGRYNLGVAHGIPGVVGWLGRVCAAGIAHDQARELLAGAVSWLLAQRWPPGGEAAFATWIAPNESPPASRVSWCYGNPGLAVSLLLAARAVGEENWERVALELALESAARGVESPVPEACLCHGSAGNGHLFNRLFQATGDTRFRDAAVAWFERTLELHRPGSGLAGFESRVPVDGGKIVWKGAPGFLNGVAGIGLALLAATTAVEPAWDRVLLCSVPASG